MATFEAAIDTVLHHEGGWVNNPADPGGATNYGVSLRWLKTQGYAGDLDHDGDVDAMDVRVLTPEIATRFYRDEFWRRQYDQFFAQAIATKVFDTAVNCGHGPAHKILQRALNSFGAQVQVDGWVGPKTVLAANMAETEALLWAMRGEQGKFYSALIARNPKLAVFATGWANRARS